MFLVSLFTWPASVIKSMVVFIGAPVELVVVVAIAIAVAISVWLLLLLQHEMEQTQISFAFRRAFEYNHIWSFAPQPSEQVLFFVSIEFCIILLAEAYHRSASKSKD